MKIMSLEPCLTMLGKMCVGEPTAKGVTYWIVEYEWWRSGTDTFVCRSACIARKIFNRFPVSMQMVTHSFGRGGHDRGVNE